MKKHNKLAAFVALSLLLLLTAFTTKTPTEKISDSDAPADSAPVLSLANVASSTTETDEFHILTITYRDAEGNEIAPSVAKAVPACDAYCVGTTGDDTCTLTINYVDSDGNPIAPSTTAELKASSIYQVPGR